LRDWRSAGSAETRRGELDAADLRWRDDIAGHADHEQVAEALVEHDLGRYARIRASQDDGERLLMLLERHGAGIAKRGIAFANAGDETLIALAQAVQGVLCRNHGSCFLAVTGGFVILSARCAPDSGSFKLRPVTLRSRAAMLALPLRQRRE
jgi:hypothetical protein